MGGCSTITSLKQLDCEGNEVTKEELQREFEERMFRSSLQNKPNDWAFPYFKGFEFILGNQMFQRIQWKKWVEKETVEV